MFTNRNPNLTPSARRARTNSLGAWGNFGLKQAELGEVLFKRFEEQLAAKGLIAKGGQMVDATFVEVPKSRNSREDNAKLKAGEIPEDWKKEDAATGVVPGTPFCAPRS